MGNRIYPKTDEDLCGLDKLEPFINEGLEIQLLRDDDRVIRTIPQTLKNKFPNLKEITFHLPMYCCDIDKILVNVDLYRYMSKVIERATAVSNILGIKINILAHCGIHLQTLEDMNIKNKFLYLLRKLEFSDVLILLENTWSVLEVPIKREQAYSVVKGINHDNLKMCLDICHVHTVINMLQRDMSYIEVLFENDNLKDIVHQIHFSATLNNDGFKDLNNTHSKPYPDKQSMLDDIRVLEVLGCGEAAYVTEVVEPDYNSRELELKLLNMLTEI